MYDNRGILRETPLFAGLSESSLTALSAICRRRQAPAGETLFLKGDAGHHLYVIVGGVVRIATVSPTGREMMLNLMTTGDIVGEIAVLDGGERTAEATVDEDATLLVIERGDLMALLRRDAEACLALLAACAGRLRWVSLLLEEAAFQPLPARLARRLLLLGAAFGRPVEDGIRIGLRLSQRDLAAHVNVSRESINKVLKDWDAQGLIQRDGPHIVLRRPDQLARLCETES